MIYRIPHYYKKFHCTSTACPATCCAGWQIVIDKKSLEKYRNMRGAFGNRMANSVDWEQGTFLQYHKRCALLNEENLCDLYREAGPGYLCATCRKYPRHIEEFENEREISLSMSCPEAASIILGTKEKVTFQTARDEKEDREDEDFDELFYSALLDCREELFALLQNRREPVRLRMAKVLALGHDLQSRIDRGNLFELENLLEKSRGEKAASRCLEKMRAQAKSAVLTQQQMGQAFLGMLDHFEVLEKGWRRDLKTWREILYEQSPEDYQKEREEFLSREVIPETEYEQMMVYFLYTYFCGAVYDGEALAKIKMAVVSTLIWEEVVFALWLSGKSSFEERLRAAWRYSRELEHSDQNLNELEYRAGIRLEATCKCLIQRLFTNII